jgi:tRNA-dihydrouridine synthase A
MMDWTDRHCRAFMRLLSPNARLYTEMIHTGAILKGERARILRFDKSEHPVALQLGGNDRAAPRSANASATTRSTSTVAARLIVCSTASLAPA